MMIKLTRIVNKQCLFENYKPNKHGIILTQNLYTLHIY